MTQPTGTVTFLFTDVQGSTRLWDSDPENMRVGMARHDEILRTTIEANRGSIFTTAGDAFCAAFAAPGDALSAAVSVQLALTAENWDPLPPMMVRMALHTGNADERDGDYFGAPLNRCARLQSTGHGGQTLVSAATAQLLRDDLGPVSLRDLGTHELKDLERPEHVFQVVHPDLPDDFPPLNSLTPVLDAASCLAEGRQAFAAQDWERAYAAYASADDTVELSSGDLERFGEAAWWSGLSDEGMAIREKAYAALVKEGRNEAAAQVALLLAESHKYRLAKTIAKAWVARARQLLDGRELAPAHGYLVRWDMGEALGDGDLEGALVLGERLMQIGTELDNPDLVALALQDKGKVLIADGKIRQGLELIDEAMLSAVAGELDAMTTGRSYCNMLDACITVADYERAGEWTDAAKSWCEGHSDSAYPGICRMIRAELTWLRGSWDEAAEECRRAISELNGFPPIIGATLHKVGEIALRAGRHDEAAADFQRAHEHGFTPLPGLARLRQAEGKPEEARALLANALDAIDDAAGRAKLLPALVDVLIELDEIAAAQTALDELDTTAGICDSLALRAEVALRRGRLALQSGAAAEAVPHYQAAIDGWTSLRMPYEAAAARTELAVTRTAEGNVAAARLEFESARSAFERLGAASDVTRVEALLPS